jgi:hypothetical protein
MRKLHAVCFCTHGVREECILCCGVVGMCNVGCRCRGWSIQLDIMGGDPIGRVHKSVVLSLPPSNMILSSYHIMHLSLLKHTLQPASVRTLMPKSNAIDKSEIMCPVRTVGRPLMCTSHS